MPKTEELSGRVTLDLTKTPEIPADHGTMEAAAKMFVVADEQSYEIAAQMIQTSAARIARVEQFFEADKTLAHRLHKSICDKISSITAPWRAVRPELEPKMRVYRKRQDDLRRQEDLRVQREAELAQARAREEAAAIQRAADQRAAELRKQGDIRQAREAEAAAAEKAQAVEQQAQAIADVGVILPAAPKVAGLGSSQPWEGVLDDPLKVALAVLRNQIPYMWKMPVRGGGEQEVPIFTINMAVLTEQAKRLGKEDIGIPGAHGQRGLQLRFSKGAAAAPDKDGW